MTVKTWFNQNNYVIIALKFPSIILSWECTRKRNTAWTVIPTKWNLHNYRDGIVAMWISANSRLYHIIAQRLQSGLREASFMATNLHIDQGWVVYAVVKERRNEELKGDDIQLNHFLEAPSLMRPGWLTFTTVLMMVDQIRTRFIKWRRCSFCLFIHRFKRSNDNSTRLTLLHRRKWETLKCLQHMVFLWGSTN